nr:helix-turn-helix transcriptional regulator [Pseudogemmobacter faecipullorum]
MPFLGAKAAVIIGRRTLRAQIFAARHRLTPAEAKVASLILQGHRPKEIARDLGVSVETVRSQLKAVFAKTGAASQADLVRIAADGTM